MSRRQIPARPPGFTVVVGWDKPLATYFTQVTRIDEVDDDGDSVVLWLGGFPGEVGNAEDLVGPLLQYADLTPDMIAQLRADRVADPDAGLTEFQQDMLSGLGRRS